MFCTVQYNMEKALLLFYLTLNKRRVKQELVGKKLLLKLKKFDLFEGPTKKIPYALQYNKKYSITFYFIWFVEEYLNIRTKSPASG